MSMPEHFDPSTLPAVSLTDVPIDAMCCICLGPKSDNVTLCRESHNACRTCADRYLSTSGPSAKCPQGCTSLCRPEGRWISNKAINNVIATATIHCPHAEAGCTKSLTLTAVRAHVKLCEYRTVPCKIDACTWRGTACSLDEHMKKVDHSSLMVDMMLQTQQRVANTSSQIRALYSCVGFLNAETKKQLDAIGTGQNNMTATLSAIETNTKAPCVSHRTIQRDRKTAKDVAEVEAQLVKVRAENDAYKTTKAALETTVENLVSENYDLVSRVGNLQAEVDLARQTRDRYFADRDEARDGKRRRTIESDLLSERTHELNARLMRVLGPNEPRGRCPCRACSSGSVARVVELRYLAGDGSQDS